MTQNFRQNRRSKNPALEALLRSEVRNEDDSLSFVHHVTREEGFDSKDFAVFSHFGTRRAARKRALEWGEARMISCFLDIRNPLVLPDTGRCHDLDAWLDLISESEAMDVISGGECKRILDWEQASGEGLEMLAALLREAGWDGVKYQNDCEDPGSTSWVILDPGQVHVVSDGPARLNLDPWELSPDEFTGPKIVMDGFAIDGKDENFDHLWEEMRDSGEELPVLARDPAGWEARWLKDWEPHPTIGLFSPDGGVGGFYMRGLLWIDEDLRGNGLSSLMINAAADLVGGCPLRNTDGIGFSPAGEAAHLSALRKITEWATEQGYRPITNETSFNL